MREPEITRNPIHKVNRVDNGSDILRRLEALEMNHGSNQTMSCNSEPRTYPSTICGDQSHIGPHCPLFYPSETTRDQTFPIQTTPNPKGVNQGNRSGSSNHNEHTKAVITLRSGKTLENSVEPPKDSSLAENETEVDQTSSKDPNGPESSKSPSEEDIPERVYIPPAPFPQRLAKKKPNTYAEILDIFKKVKVNLPLLDAIKHVPAMAKFLKEMCTVKRDASVHKKAFLTQYISSIISQKYPVKFKDPGCPTVTCVIGKQTIDNALLDLGASVNLLPFSVYEQLGLGKMKPTRITLQLADRSVKIPRGIIEVFLVQVENFIYPVDFVILDTQPVSSQDLNIPIILGRPFLATANVVIHCQIVLVEFSFGNQKISVNVFKALQAPPDPEHYESICMIDSLVENTFTTNSVSDPLEACLAHLL
ncbi:uncharacterized protein LOC113352971 [Papaver somniferum]|uniref:uncharacterized protein LOC113352971 n=1 Tax=Papaver somniferum TaxID=3469 RepID=UPI000E6FB416|nr:uncharacterized protein LOC113352971 [Papaver somniferum]